MIPILAKIFGGKGKEIVTGILDGADKIFTSKEERAAFELKATEEINRHLEAMMQDATKQLELQLQDKASARTRETEFVKATGHIDWMQATVGILVLVCFIGCLVMIGFKKLPEGSEHLMINAIGIMEGLVLSVVGYYFGSSVGSRIKDMKSGSQNPG